MKANDLLEKLEEITPEHGLEPVGLQEPHLERIDDPEALKTKIGKWKGTGWIARQSGVCVIEDGAGDDPTLGPLVSAELVETSQVTHQIRRVTNGWHITTITETEGATHLADTVRHIVDPKHHIAKNDRIAVYRRYWSLPEDGACEVVAWRLTGFEKGET